MARIYRWLLRLVLGAAGLLAAGLALAYWFASRSLPDYDATLAVPGLSAPVEIVRDHANVPHLFGATDDDVFFALGFAHAQDRLWQMTMLRRTVQGRLSEIFGPGSLASDALMRRLDLYPLAVRALQVQDAPTRAMLAAYARGVNAWLAEVNRGARGRGAPEFFLYPPQIAPWQPADSLAIIKLMALEQASQIEAEVLRARASLLLPEERVADLLPDAPGSGVAALPDFAAIVPGATPTRLAERPARPPGWPLPPPALAGASNAWAADPTRSATGGTLIANDPHQRLTAPSLWYLARLELSSGPVMGATIPGMPVILAGRNARLGWGITSAYADDADLLVEALNPANPEEVRQPDGSYAPLRKQTSIVRIRDAAPVTLTLRWAEDRPILPGRHLALEQITPPGHVVSLNWTALDPADTTMTAALRLMQAGSVAEGIEAGGLYVAPSVNLVLGDGEGIAMKTLGRLPRRAAGHQSKGRMPTPAWIAANLWQGRLPYASNPEFVAPSGGIVGNTNNKTLERPFPLHVSYSWGDTQRIERWRRLMQSREVHTRDSFIEAQLDTVSPTARTLLPLVAQELWFTGPAAPEGTPERRRQRALALLADWNGEMNEHLPEPLIYAAWMRALQDRLMRDETGPLASEFTHVEPLFIERVFRDVDGAGAWCDVIQSAERESCSEIARVALDDALVWIGETFGGALESLRWGDAHEATQDHPALGRVPGLRWLVNIRQSTSGGDFTLMRGRTRGTGPMPFQNVHGAGYRGVYDLGDPDASVFIISTGQSGHPLSRHYDDLGELWRRGEYIPMSFDPALARAAAVGTTRLLPQ